VEVLQQTVVMAGQWFIKVLLSVGLAVDLEAEMVEPAVLGSKPIRGKGHLGLVADQRMPTAMEVGVPTDTATIQEQVEAVVVMEHLGQMVGVTQPILCGVEGVMLQLRQI